MDGSANAIPDMAKGRKLGTHYVRGVYGAEMIASLKFKSSSTTKRWWKKVFRYMHNHNNIHQNFPFITFTENDSILYTTSQQHWSHQHQQCHWTSPPVIISPPCLLSLVFHRYFSPAKINTAWRTCASISTILFMWSLVLSCVRVCINRCLCTSSSLYV